MSTIIKTAFGSFGLFLLLVGNCFASHPYHVSLTEIEWNPKSSNFEVAMCVWPADLEKAISDSTGTPVDFDKLSEAKTDQLMKRYLTERFELIDQAGQAGALRWAGHQTGKKAIWMFFEIRGDLHPAQWSVRNRMFIEQNEDQLNQHRVKIAESSFSVATTTDKAIVELKEPKDRD